MEFSNMKNSFISKAKGCSFTSSDPATRENSIKSPNYIKQHSKK